MKGGEQVPAAYDLTSLRLLGSVGEPINPEAWLWYHKNIGGSTTPIVDTWWQTETGAIMIAPLPGVTTTKPGSAQRALRGVAATLFAQYTVADVLAMERRTGQRCEMQRKRGESKKW